jgi:hypothetical protein
MIMFQPPNSSLLFPQPAKLDDGKEALKQFGIDGVTVSRECVGA